MRHIHPINEENCKEHYGKPVLIILRNGGEVVGILTKFGNGQIILNGDDTAVVTNRGKSAKKSSVKGNKNKNKAKVSFSPFPNTSNPFGGALVLDLAFVALLFAFI
ncbi:hypothetical protein GC093_11630 [Paenibacillus sp. LMG 31456]|uniref:Uncharacterized protein n=1 Tax=Paenibacillus foliorum TaxID=2654974 RepID=A0A972H0C2_9BACL|nr:hypothetical protein [Paenibacillus foliorum]NOU93871.1 hypothetical protein [Paenibacillus foliorum]